MIRLKVPSGEVSYYMLHSAWTLCTLGPFSANGEDTKDIQYRHAGDFIEGTPAIFGENNVKHEKTSGDLYINPLGSLPSRRLQDPEYPWKREYFFNRRWNTSYFGVISGRKSVKVLKNGTYYLYQWVGTPRDMTLYSGIISARNYGKSEKIGRYDECSITRRRLQVLEVDSERLRIKVHRTSLTAQMGQTRTYDNLRSWSSIREGNLSALFGSNTYTYSPSTSEYYENLFAVKNVWSKQSSMDAVDLMASEFRRMKDPSHKHYGELAMSASGKIASNQANMYEFISELRNPKQLIPKLKNLGRLKNAAENYLTLNYGILPTISDLKEIFGAFKKSKYYDKNKFSVVTAVDHQHVEVGLNREFESIRRLKLAVGDNDSQLEKILSNMENMGVLPTFQNLWDLVPFSFVIDWFVDVGNFLERVDSRLRLARLDIQYVTQSQKSIRTVYSNVLDDEIIVGSLKKVHYSRWTSNQSPVPPLLPEFKPSFQNHWLEAGALIVANRK